MWIPRINVYLPDDLAAAARPLGLNLSNLLQSALRERLDALRIETWLGDLDAPTSIRGGHAAALAALDEIESESGHG